MSNPALNEPDNVDHAILTSDSVPLRAIGPIAVNVVVPPLLLRSAKSTKTESSSSTIAALPVQFVRVAASTSVAENPREENETSKTPELADGLNGNDVPLARMK